MPRNQAIFRAGGVVLSSRLIEGQFPSWRQLIPESFEHEVRLPREELLEVSRRVSQLAQRNAPLRLAFAEGELTVAAETPEIGDASEGMPAPYSASRWRSPSTRSSSSRASRASRATRSRSGLLAAAARAAAAGRQRGLQLPRDADPAQRLRRRAGMRVRRVTTLGFRNLADAEVELGDGRHAVWGPNGAGKTNLLEALYLALAGAPPRTTHEREAIAFGEPLARVEVEVDGREAASTHCSAARSSAPASAATWSTAAPVDAAAHGRAAPAAAVFMPDRLVLVKGPPAARRAHLDRFCAALWPARAEARRRYGRALAQRNALLGPDPCRGRRGGARSTPGTPELAAAGAELIEIRSRRGRGRLAGRFTDGRRRAGPRRRRRSSRYRPRSDAGRPQELAAELAERRDADLGRGFTTHGPHLDELVAQPRRPRAAPLRLAGRAAPGAAGAAVRRARGPARRGPPAAADAPRRRDVRARPATAGPLLCERLVAGGGQALITATEPAQLPAECPRRELAMREGERSLAEAATPGRPRPREAASSSRASAPRPPRRLGDALGAVRDRDGPGDPARGRSGRLGRRPPGPAVAAQAEPVAERDGVVTVACHSADLGAGAGPARARSSWSGSTRPSRRRPVRARSSGFASPPTPPATASLTVESVYA